MLRWARIIDFFIRYHSVLVHSVTVTVWQIEVIKSFSRFLTHVYFLTDYTKSVLDTYQTQARLKTWKRCNFLLKCWPRLIISVREWRTYRKMFLVQNFPPSFYEKRHVVNLLAHAQKLQNLICIKKILRIYYPILMIRNRLKFIKSTEQGHNLCGISYAA